jgi:hypothetical protein
MFQRTESMISPVFGCNGVYTPKSKDHGLRTSLEAGGCFPVACHVDDGAATRLRHLAGNGLPHPKSAEN